MALSAFESKAAPPTPDDLQQVLGPAWEAWEGLIRAIDAAHGPITQVWGFPGAKYGWSLRLKRGDRVILYMTPQVGAVLTGFVLGERAAALAHERGLPTTVLELIDVAPRYAEGRGFRMSLATAEDVATAMLVVGVKMA